jgi:hypothetical protein
MRVDDPLVLVDVCIFFVGFRNANVGVESGGSGTFIARNITGTSVQIEITISSGNAVEGMLGGLDVGHRGARFRKGAFQHFVAQTSAVDVRDVEIL